MSSWPIALSFRPCANIRRLMATRMIGISRIWRPGRSAAPRSVFTEAAAVTPEGRISPQDLGVWSEKHFEPLERIRALHGRAGRPRRRPARACRVARRSTFRPGVRDKAPIAESDRRVAPGRAERDRVRRELRRAPAELTIDEIYGRAEGRSRRRLERAATPPASGVIEIHGSARLSRSHEFLLPAQQPARRRLRRLVREPDATSSGHASRRCAAVLPERCPLFVRTSATEWAEGGWDIEQSVELARLLLLLGVDLIDCSSGGNLEKAEIRIGPGYQTCFAAEIRRARGRRADGRGGHDHVARAGRSHHPHRASGSRISRPRDAARSLFPKARGAGVEQIAPWPVQYLRAAPRGTPERALAPVPRVRSMQAASA